MTDRATPRQLHLTHLTIGRSAALAVQELCACGGDRRRRAWKGSDIRNEHTAECPAAVFLARLPAIQEEVALASQEPSDD